MASALLAMGSSAVLLPFNVGAQNEQENARRTVALYMARELMEEIISKPFDDPDGVYGLGPDAGESSRALYDNIDDYYKYKDGYGVSISQIVGINNQTIDGVVIDGLTRKVTISYAYVDGQDESEEANFALIKVTVLYKGDRLVVLRRLIHDPQ